MPLWIRLLIAGALSIDLIAVSKAIITGLAISPAVSSLWRNNLARRQSRRNPSFRLRRCLAAKAGCYDQTETGHSRV